MVKKLSYFLASALVIALSFSCKHTIAITTDMTDPKTFIQGSWVLTTTTEMTINAAGQVVSRNEVQVSSNRPITTLASNGTYQAGSSTGTWQLSADNSKLIYDKGRNDERYYINTTLTPSLWIAEGPYQTDGTLSIAGKKYAYQQVKK